jgi:DNA-binding MarR family transcriptional regulator
MRMAYRYAVSMFNQCLYFNASALARAVEREWAKAYAPLDLTPAQAFMLRLVLDSPGMLPHQIAENLAISRPTATRLLDGLEAKHLIDRRTTLDDGRELQIYPTARAKARKPSIEAASRATTRRIRRLVGQESLAETVGRLRSVRAALR